MMPSMTRRAALAILLAPLTVTVRAAEPDPVFAAILRAEAADADHLFAGRLGLELFGPSAPRPAGWLAYRASLAEIRRAARYDLRAVTPTTAEGARALVAFYASNAERSGDPCAVRSARRKLRRVFARPGAPPMPALPASIEPRPPPA